MKVDHIYVSGETTVAEMTSTSTALNGRPYPQKVLLGDSFVDGLIVEARAYLDSLLDENERRLLR